MKSQDSSNSQIPLGRKRKRWVYWVSAVMALSLFIFLAVVHIEYLGALSHVEPVGILAVAGLFLLSRCFSSEGLRRLIVRLGNRIRFAEAYLVNVVAGYANLFVPSSGLAAPFVYYPRRNGVPYADVATALSLFAVLQLSSIGIAGILVTLIGISDRNEAFSLMLLTVFGGCLAIPLLLIFARVPRCAFRLGRVVSRIDELHAYWRRLANKPSVVVAVLLLQLTAMLLRAYRLKVCFALLGVSVPFEKVLIMSLLGDLAMLSGLTPAGLGLRELFITYSGSILMVPDMVMAAAFLDRIVWTVVIALAAQPALWFLARLPSGSAPGK